jgi:hypothetical protein
VNDDAVACEPCERHPEGLPCITKYGILVPSRSLPGHNHLVTRPGGRWHCECVGFFYRGNCRHVEAAQSIYTPRELMEM